MADTRSPTLLAQHAAKLRYEDLPPALVELVKRCILDTLGVSIAATTLAPEARIVADYVEDMGGRKVATVWGYGRKAPAPWAVFVNGSLGHMVDYDDVGAGGHVSIVTMVTYLAKEGAVPKGSTPAELAATMQAELAKWGKVIRSANIKFE